MVVEGAWRDIGQINHEDGGDSTKMRDGNVEVKPMDQDTDERRVRGAIVVPVGLTT